MKTNIDKSGIVIIIGILFILCSCEVFESGEAEPPVIDPVDYAWAEAFPSQKAEVVKLESGVRLEKKGDHYIWQSDIVLSEIQVEALDKEGTLFSSSSPNAYQLWTNEIPFTIHQDMPQGIKETILAVMGHWESQTNLKFDNVAEELSNNPNSIPDYIKFVCGDGNWSYLGRIGGEQILSIDTVNMNQFTSYYHILGHELGHALGKVNTQSRYDRDEYIAIHYDNIKSEKQICFDKMSENEYSIDVFDFESIMLSPSVNNFSVGGLQTMTLKGTSGNKPNTWEINFELSEGDISWFNRFYSLK